MIVVLTEAKPPLFASERIPSNDEAVSLFQRLADLPPITVSFNTDQLGFESDCELKREIFADVFNEIKIRVINITNFIKKKYQFSV